MKRIISLALIIIGPLISTPTASAANLPFTGAVTKGECQVAAFMVPLATDIKNISQLALSIISRVPGAGKVATLGNLAITGAGNIGEAINGYPMKKDDPTEVSAFNKLRDGIIGMNAAKDTAVEITSILTEPMTAVKSWDKAGTYEVAIDPSALSKDQVSKIFQNKIRPGATNFKLKAVQFVKVEKIGGVLTLTKTFTAIGVVGDVLSLKETGSKIIGTPKDISSGLNLCSMMK